jgi:hypothetical protein
MIVLFFKALNPVGAPEKRGVSRCWLTPFKLQRRSGKKTSLLDGERGDQTSCSVPEVIRRPDI